MDAGTSEDLLFPVVNDYDRHTWIGKVAEGRALIDRGSTVEWFDGDRVSTLTLPDQPRRDGVPVLSSVVTIDTEYWSPRVNAPERFVILVDESGQRLASLARINDAIVRGYQQVDFERIWPDVSFSRLAARGVASVHESAVDFREVNRMHPGTVGRWSIVTRSRRIVLTTWTVLAALIMVGLLVALLTR
jgi:hypothetical protein